LRRVLPNKVRYLLSEGASCIASSSTVSSISLV
jgi:hypothetical protein